MSEKQEKQKKEKKIRKMKKPRLKILIPLVLVLALGGFMAYRTTVVNARPDIKTVDTYVLAASDLTNTVNVTGMVQSDSTEEVYSTLQYKINRVAVEVGDTVAEGDLLCQFDTSDLEATIAQTSATLSSAQAKANHGVAMAEKDLETSQFNVEEDYNTQLLEAESAVKRAENAVEQAEHNLKVARRTLDDEVERNISVEGNYVYQDTTETKEQAVTQAEIALDGARQTLEASEAALRASKMLVKESQVSGEDAVTNAKLNADFSDQYIALQKLQNDLAKATITSPISGVVTAVYAKEGAAGTGLLFVIEDPDRLKVDTKIKEYDVGGVSVGQPVVIKADATGDEEFAGELAKIAPTTLKDAGGKTVDTTSAEFAAEVRVTSVSKLRIGMNARMNIITQKKENVLSVPVDAIVTDEDGQQIIYTMEAQEDGTHTAKANIITTGMETDFLCEVLSGLQDGDEIIINMDGLEDGMLVQKLDQQMIDQALLA